MLCMEPCKWLANLFAAVESPACGLTAVWCSRGLRLALTQQTRAAVVRSGPSDAHAAQPLRCAGSLEAHISVFGADEPCQPPPHHITGSAPHQCRRC